MTRINVEQLRTFLTVVRLGGVRKAAAALHLTQPAITARIKNLEDTLACALFDRHAGGMRLTKRGELLLAHAEKFEHLSEMVERDVVDPQGENAEQLDAIYPVLGPLMGLPELRAP